MTIKGEMEQVGAVLDLDWISCVESIMDGRFWCLNDARNVLQFGRIKIEAWKIRNQKRKGNLIQSYLIQTLSNPILSLSYLTLSPAARGGPYHISTMYI